MAARTAISENRQTGLVLVRLCFGHQVAWLVAPTAGSPSASPPGWVSPGALPVPVLLQSAPGSPPGPTPVWLVRRSALEFARPFGVKVAWESLRPLGPLLLLWSAPGLPFVEGSGD